MPDFIGYSSESCLTQLHHFQLSWCPFWCPSFLDIATLIVGRIQDMQRSVETVLLGNFR